LKTVKISVVEQLMHDDGIMRNSTSWRERHQQKTQSAKKNEKGACEFDQIILKILSQISRQRLESTLLQLYKCFPKI